MHKMFDHEKIIEFIRAKGLVLPVQLAKEFKKDTILMGAVLSELVSAKKIKISCVKIGGSPVYYVKEQAYKLQELYKHLNEKDKRAYDFLKTSKILRDSDLTPLQRVSLRQIKDFAKPLSVKAEGKEELFWKWYMVSHEDASRLIREYFSTAKDKEKPEDNADNKYNSSGQHNNETNQKEQTKINEKPESEKTIYEDEQDNEKTNADKEKQREQDKQSYDKNKKQSAFSEKKQMSEKQARLIKKEQYNDNEQSRKTNASPITESIKTGNNESVKTADETQKTEDTGDNAGFEGIKDKLHKKIKTFFNKKEIIIKSLKIIRKNSEIEYILAVPSTVGRIKYYCKAKSKKKINDSDLASAYVRGQMKKLPVLFIATGSLSNKAKEMLGTDFENLKVIKLG